MIKILVTGAGALLGQGIIRCLKMIKDMDIFIISADPSAKSTGHFIADKSYLIPFAVDETYILKIEEIIEKEKIDIVFVGTDTELPKLSINKEYLENKYGIKVVVSNNHVIEIANDKWKTSEFLKENNFPYPISALTIDKKAILKLMELNEYPYIAKPIDGARSLGVQIINNKDELISICNFPNNLVVQELIGMDNEEYTSGCLVVNGKCKSIVTLRRDLRDGNTWRAYRNGDNPYDENIKEIAEKLNPDGPVNFQFRIKNGFPIIFEINGRFSGTTPLRAMFGFNEVEALLKYYFLGIEIEQPQLKNGTVLRTFSDLFVDNNTIDELSVNKVINKPNSMYFPFK
jgi:carbamoyl-phosphate synthase large subunit